ncbi:hypothetical protein GOV09_07020 [Candidatus Woesearchaeota archaeon]|nr:hypothetical protein [Candidatus Woesearchaeota archaeon]
MTEPVHINTEALKKHKGLAWELYHKLNTEEAESIDGQVGDPAPIFQMEPVLGAHEAAKERKRRRLRSRDEHRRDAADYVATGQVIRAMAEAEPVPVTRFTSPWAAYNWMDNVGKEMAEVIAGFDFGSAFPETTYRELSAAEAFSADAAPLWDGKSERIDQYAHGKENEWRFVEQDPGYTLERRFHKHGAPSGWSVDRGHVAFNDGTPHNKQPEYIGEGPRNKKKELPHVDNSWMPPDTVAQLKEGVKYGCSPLLQFGRLVEERNAVKEALDEPHFLTGDARKQTRTIYQDLASQVRTMKVNL